jgi:uncharacterized repeat protein (TIGR01451 family)
MQTALGQSSKDLPNPSPNLTSIPDGSLVIAMDNTNQAVVAPFNLKAYGLVNNLLQNGIPVLWAIRAGKAKDGVDFTATAQRDYPTATGATAYNFAGGPFIVHRDFAALAKTKIAAFGNSVAVYELTGNPGGSTTVDIRYQLTNKPNIAVSNTNTTIHTNVLNAAGISNYTVVDPTTLSASSCYTSHSEPHTSLTAGVPNVKAFVQSGANFLAECLAVDTYENGSNGHFQTTLGVATNNLSNTLSYPNPDLSFTQFIGALNPAPGGSEQDYDLATGSVFQNNGHVDADNIGSNPDTFAASAAKLYNGSYPGGMVFYLGGHSYNSTSDITIINGMRMYLNFVLTPSTRPAGCNLDFASALSSISGHVYEDVNGDASLSDGVAKSNVTVRLYADTNGSGTLDSADTFVAEQKTDAAGLYSFQVSTQASGARYFVVVNSKDVTPSAGLNGGFTQGDVWAEQTYGDNPASSSLSMGARYGGANPSVSDNFNTGSTAVASNTYKHQAQIDAGGGSVTGVDFGFSFNVVTTTRGGDTTDDDTSANRTVQGSLRQFIQNANAIFGANAMRFVPAVAANAGSYWRVTVSNALPAVTDSSTTIDGTAYSSSDGTTVLNTNAATLGAGGTVGVDNVALPQLSGPELEVVKSGSVAVGFDLQASNATVRRLAVYGFGTTPNSNTSGNIRVGSVTNTLVELNAVGTTAASFTDPGATRSLGDNIRVVGGSGGTIRNNLIGFSGGKGVELGGGASGWSVTGNEVRGNGVNNSLAGLDVDGSGGATITGNLFAANEGAGVDSFQSSGGNTISNNTVTGNGVGTGASVVTAGVRLYGAGSTVSRNIVNANFGAGVSVTSGASADTITHNSIYANGTITNKGGAGPSNQIGIDLLSAADNQSAGTPPFVTVNDSGDADAGGNSLLNFPVLTSARILNGNLVLKGYASPGSVIEFFVAAPDPSGFGEGQTYLLTLTEGSAADADATTGTYTSPVGGLNVGTDTTNLFQFTVPVPAGVAVGTVLTATATVGGSTSEFSGNVTVAAAPPDVSLVKSCTSPSDCTTAPQPPGTDLAYKIDFANGGGSPAQQFVITDQVPANTDYKLNSAATNLGTTGLAVAVAYSNDGGATWAYTPASGAGGAPSGYDRNVTHVRWTFTGNLSQASPNNAGSVSFVTRIR